MANLTFQSPRLYFVDPQITIDYPMDAVKLYEGAALSDKSSIYQGHFLNGTNVVHNLVGGENFVGFANATIDNSAGTSGGTTLSVVTQGIVKLVITGLSASSLGEWVYASDGNTFTVETQEYNTNSVVGRVCKIISVSAGTALVNFQGIGFTSV